MQQQCYEVIVSHENLSPSPVKHPTKKIIPYTSSDEEEIVLQRRSKRQCKRIKYNFSENEEETDDEEECQQDYDDDDYEEMD